jgi:tetratricopeptide (TPR) repeat protein
VPSGAERLRAHFAELFRSEPETALSQWFRVQEELGERGDAETTAALAEDLWACLGQLRFGSTETRARFFHNAAVFFGSPGPAADLARAREAFGEALGFFGEHTESGWRARALHNLATAISNLGTSPAELEEAVALFEQALAWRTSEREIARGVTLHNLGLALRRLAELDPERSRNHLERGISALEEAARIRERHRLSEGLAATRRELDESLRRLAAVR